MLVLISARIICQGGEKIIRFDNSGCAMDKQHPGTSSAGA